MKRNPICFTRWFTAAALLLAAGALSAADLVKYDAQPGSKVKLDGTSTIHDWTIEGQIIGGSMEADPAVLTDAAKAKNTKADVTIPVRSLKSGNKKMDSVMMQAFKVEGAKNAVIKYKLTELTLKEPAKSADSLAKYDAKGELTVSGVTKPHTMAVAIQPAGPDKLKVTGASELKMTDFQIKPPVLVGLLSTGDEVKVNFEWLTAKAAAETKTADSK